MLRNAIRRFFGTEIARIESGAVVLGSGPSEVRLHPRWLRAACPCSECVLPGTTQRLHSTASLSLASGRLEQIEAVKVVDSHLIISWAGPTNHISRLPLSLVKPSPPPRLPPPVHWKQLTASQVTIQYDDYNTDAGLHRALQLLRIYGICLVQNSPVHHDTVGNVAKRIGPIRNTFYGETWDVKSVKGASNIAYTDHMLGMHQDLCYFEAPPGLQLLHCLSPSDTGGETVFTDGLRVAEYLREHHREYFDILRRIPVTYMYKSVNDVRYYKHPLIRTLADGHTVTTLQYSPMFEGTLEIDFQDSTLFYDAYEAFTRLAEDQSMHLSRRLLPGEVILFNNRRILHGRKTFECIKQVRHLRGAYLDLDDFHSKLRVLESKAQ